jgi:uncharacterized protein (DUF2235 family)
MANLGAGAGISQREGPMTNTGVEKWLWRDKSKNIVVCCDGTGQKLDVTSTNVVRLFAALDRSDPDRQVAYYDPGIGTMPAAAALTPMARLLTRWAGLIAGFGVLDNVAKAYGFIVDHYKPGDKIYLVGFSRGALTVRLIGGLLHCAGVLRPDAKNLIPYALELYGKHLTHMYDKNTRRQARAVIEEFRKTFSVNGKDPVDIHFLGVWDTVKAFGIFRPKSFPHLRHNPSVKMVRHALALDERRAAFMFTSWGGLYGSVEANSPHDQDVNSPHAQDVKEVWFAGDHSDVGGGHREEESGLSWRSLRWMVGEACHAGLRFRDPHSATTAPTQLPKSHKMTFWRRLLALLLPRFEHGFFKCHRMKFRWWLLDLLLPRFELENAPPRSRGWLLALLLPRAYLEEEEKDDLPVPLGWPKLRFKWPDGTRFPEHYRRRGRDKHGRDFAQPVLLHWSVQPLVKAGKYRLHDPSYDKDTCLPPPHDRAFELECSAEGGRLVRGRAPPPSCF